MTALNNNNAIGLSTLLQHVRQVITLNYERMIWLTAEVAEAKQSRGHWYLSLIEKKDGQIIAQVAATLWQRRYHELCKDLGESLLEHLIAAGIELRLQVQVTFSERFGFSLQIHQIDGNFTLGQMALQRLQTLEKLRHSGLLYRQQRLALPMVPQRVAVITSSGATGWQDFRQQLATNPHGYKFELVLLHSAVQGVHILPHALRAFEWVQQQSHRIDLVVILRGGGSRADLAAFDNLELCEAAAQLPLPLFTGIGHQTDESLLDLVAHTALKTPTAVADYLVDLAAKFETQCIQSYQTLRKVATQRHRLWLSEHQQHEQRVRYAVAGNLKRAHSALDLTNRAVQLLNPHNVLQRGYALVMHPQGSIATVASLEAGQIVHVLDATGRAAAQVVSTVPSPPADASSVPEVL